MKRILAFIFACFAACAGEITSQNDVEYGVAGGKRLLLDVIRPAGEAPPRAAVIMVHGGGWIGGDKRDMRAYAEPVAREGMVVFNINYRLAFGRENIWPAPLDDVQRAVRWVRKNAATYGVDPARIGAMGASAGGHLVAMLGLVETRDNSDASLAGFSSRVKCVVDIFGPTDLADDLSKKVPLGMSANDMVRQLLGGTPAEKPDAVREASPLFRIGKDAAAFQIWHGRKDSIVPADHSERFHAALKQAGAVSELIIFEDEDHGWKRRENQARFAKEAMDFLKRHLGGAVR
jgi:acetyl esterase/lipase